MEHMEQEEKEQQKKQINKWKRDKPEIVKFFNKFNLNINNLYDHIIHLGYEKMRTVCYLLSKIRLAVKVCDYLNTLEKEERRDVDVMKIYFLVSHAEITMDNFGVKGNKKELVRKFFEPITKKYGLNYKIRYEDSSRPMLFSDILYGIRNDYTHAGNYIGRIFKTMSDEDDCPNYCSFYDKYNKMIYFCFNLTCKEFTDIFMDALVKNIKIFSKYKK